MSNGRIKQLDYAVANQIAAGEVIERPAAVVKELLENSLDAGADKISIEFHDEQDRIQIRDNGTGIDKDDLILAVSPHATSKISAVSDLNEVATLGFRGEALASISSVSRFCLMSRTARQETGFALEVNGRDTDKLIKAVAHPEGTTIRVDDLFFNTPARKKFLSSAKTEFHHLETVVKRIALSRRHVAFELIHNQRVLLNLPKADDEIKWHKRIGKIFSKAFIDNAHVVDNAREEMNVYGFLGSPKQARSSNDWQYCYLNGRMIKDKVISHAIRLAFQHHLPEGRQASFLLYIDIDPALIDVNVHPTKHEVRFSSPRLVHDFIYQAIESSLGNNTLQPQRLEPNLAKPSVEVFESKNLAVKETPLQFLRLIRSGFALIEFAGQTGIINLSAAMKGYIAQQLIDAPLPLPSKSLLIPERINIASLNDKTFEQLQTVLANYGFGLDNLAPQTWVLRKVPSALADVDGDWLLQQLAQQLPAIEPSRVMPLLIKSCYRDLDKLTASWFDKHRQEIISMMQQPIEKQRQFWYPLTTERLSDLFLETHDYA